MQNLLHFCNCFGYYMRKMCIFECMNLRGYRMGIVAGFYRAGCLENNVSVIEKLVYIMDRDTRLSVPRRGSR